MIFVFVESINARERNDILQLRSIVCTVMDQNKLVGNYKMILAYRNKEIF